MEKKEMNLNVHVWTWSLLFPGVKWGKKEKPLKMFTFLLVFAFFWKFFTTHYCAFRKGCEKLAGQKVANLFFSELSV